MNTTEELRSALKKVLQRGEGVYPRGLYPLMGGDGSLEVARTTTKRRCIERRVLLTGRWSLCPEACSPPDTHPGKRSVRSATRTLAAPAAAPTGSLTSRGSESRAWGRREPNAEQRRRSDAIDPHPGAFALLAEEPGEGIGRRTRFGVPCRCVVELRREARRSVVELRAFELGAGLGLVGVDGRGVSA